MKLPSKVFIDTSFFIALLNSNDADHAQTVALQARLSKEQVSKVSSEFVLLELGDGLSRLRFRSLASQLIGLVYQDKTFEIIAASPGLLQNRYPCSTNGSTKSGASPIVPPLSSCKNWGLKML